KMSAFWAVFLLCSLLASSQGLGIMSSVAKVDVDDGVLAGLLGGDGVLGDLLEKDGIVDGLLGKDGLVDGLLDVVLDLLVGKNGLLGKDGLAGNLLGGNGGDFTGAKIVNNTLPKISLRSLPGLGHQVGFKTQLLVETKSAGGRALCVQVEADVTMLVQDKWAALQNNDCKASNINIHVSTFIFQPLVYITLFPIFLLPRPNVPLLDQPLKLYLSDVLSEVGCDLVNNKLNMVSALLGSRTPALLLEGLGDLPPFSIISGNAIKLDLTLPFEDMEGSVVASTQGQPLTATLLLATGHLPQLSLSQRALDVLLELAQGQEAFNLNITDSMVPDSISLSTSALLPVIPQLAKILPRSLPLELHVWVANKPVVAVRGRRATATLKASIDVVSPLLQLSQKPLYSLNMDIILNIIPSVSDGKLQTTLDLDSIKLTRASLRLNPLNVSALAEWIKQVLATAYVPAINNAANMAIPLPTILDTSFKNAKVDITDVRITFPTA
ncbi:BPIB3 protein, partial [Aramus guarauna]|nr:BPIB3 protein [Aramus guarauna]